MLTTIILSVLGGITYLNLGVLLGKLSWKVWNRKIEKSDYLKYLFLPYTSKNLNIFKPIIANTNEQEYLKVMSVIWPFKIIWNFYALAFIITSKYVGKILNVIVSIGTLPYSIYPMLQKWRENRKARLAIQAQTKELPPLDRAKLESEIEKLDRRIIDAVAERDKKLALIGHRR